MSSHNPYRPLVDAFAQLVGTPLPPLSAVTARPAPPTDAPTALIFAPHPDDETIIGALALRLLREAGVRVVNVAVTLGSREDRRTERLRELREACGWLGFEVRCPAGADRGFERIYPETRVHEPAHWGGAVTALTALLAETRPALVFMPHDADWNRAHIGTHRLVLDALAEQPADFRCLVAETEFWATMQAPNLMVESSAEDVADLVAALSLHRGEVARNPYHLRLPAWLIDSVRRGAELVGGQGGAAPDFAFASLYRLRRWADGGLVEALSGGRVLARGDDPGALLAL